jgi:hypothetical protein
MNREEIMKEYREDLECAENTKECMTCPHYRDCLKDAMEK